MVRTYSFELCEQSERHGTACAMRIHSKIHKKHNSLTISLVSSLLLYTVINIVGMDIQVIHTQGYD